MKPWRGTSGRAAGSTLLLGAALAVGGCSSSFPSVEEMQAIPGARSLYPGSVVYDSSARPPERNLMADNTGELQTVACTTASVPELAQWFDGQLEAAGWTVAPGYQSYWTPPPSGSGLSSVTARVPTEWRRNDAVLVLTPMSEDDLRWYRDKHPDAAAAAARVGCSTAYRTLLSMTGTGPPTTIR
jgi:hypothetical protein